MRHLIPFLLSACFLICANAATNIAASVSLVDVSNAVYASSAGDTVTIPAGSATWTNKLTIEGPISLIGAGENQTLIIDSFTTAVTWDYLITTHYTGASFARISGFTICGSSYPSGEIGVTSTNAWRIDHVSMTNVASGGIATHYTASGLIDHCTISTPPHLGATGVAIFGDGDYDWDVRPPNWGGTNKIYVEDCHFYWNGVNGGANGFIDSYDGARWCARYNFATNSNFGDHGADSGGYYRATHSFEVYNNFIYGDATNSLIFFSFRGGTGPIFSNTVVALNGSDYNGIRIDDYRCGGTNIYKGIIPCCDPWGPLCATNAHDGLTDALGYPGMDMIGRTSPTIHYTNVTAPNGIGTDGYTVQPAQPMFAWSNTFNGVLGMPIQVYDNGTNIGVYNYIPTQQQILLLGRDFYNNIPMIVNGTNYVPLVYPHPLQSQGGSGGGNQQPAPGFSGHVPWRVTP